MQHFFADPSCVDGEQIRLAGSDVNHMKNVLRMKPGEEVWVSDGEGMDYFCSVEGYEEKEAVLRVVKKEVSQTELASHMILFQGLPKGDKMEWIVQKAVELGAYSIVPFAAKRSVVKLDQKKAGKKRERWQAIAKGAAEQSKRGIVNQRLIQRKKLHPSGTNWFSSRSFPSIRSLSSAVSVLYLFGPK